MNEPDKELGSQATIQPYKLKLGENFQYEALLGDHPPPLDYRN